MKPKHLILVLLWFAGVVFAGVEPDRSVKIGFKFKATHVVKGYDHNSRLKVYVDGKLVAVSRVKKESEENTMQVKIKPGVHTVRAVLEAEYDGKWEEHTIEGGYGVDCVYEKTMEFDKPLTVELEFDITKGTSIKSVS